MPSPFPGMDPYLEGLLWPDFHARLAAAMVDVLDATLDPRYAVRQEVHTRDEIPTPDEISIYYPDVAVLQTTGVPREAVRDSGGVATLTAPVRVPVIAPIQHRERSLHIVRIGDERLITAIELISPSNKEGDGLAKFREKWSCLHANSVNLVEVDLIRRGSRIFVHPDLMKPAYLVTVTRGGQGATEAWPASLQSPLPTFPVPLQEGDTDLAIDLQAIFERIYDKARYGRSLDYSADPPPPALSPEDREWLRERIAAAGVIRG